MSVRLLLVLVVVNLGLGGGLRKAALGVWDGDGEEGEIDGVIKLGEEGGGHDPSFSFLMHRLVGWLILFSWWFLFSRVVGS